MLNWMIRMILTYNDTYSVELVDICDISICNDGDNVKLNDMSNISTCNDRYNVELNDIKDIWYVRLK